MSIDVNSCQIFVAVLLSQLTPPIGVPRLSKLMWYKITIGGCACVWKMCDSPSNLAFSVSMSILAATRDLMAKCVLYRCN